MNKKFIEESLNKNILLIQWLLFIMLAFFGLYSTGVNEIKSAEGLLITVSFLALFNLFISFKPLIAVKNTLGLSILFVIDLITITLTVFFTRGIDSDLYLVYFLIIFMSALSGNTIRSFVIATIISLIYIGLLFKNMGELNLLESSLLIRIPFFYVTSFFCSFLVEQINYYQKKVDDIEKIREKELVRFSNVMDTLIDCIIIVNANGEIIDINESVLKIYGANDKKELVGKNVNILLAAKNQRKVEKIKEEVLKEGSIKSVEVSIISKNGDRTMIDMSISAVNDMNGEPVEYVIIGRDISDRQKMERELFKASKLESISILAGGIAHDFNNILTSILGHISFARSSTNLIEIMEDLSEAEKATAQATALTRQLLVFSKGSTLVKKIVSLSGLIKEDAKFILRGSNTKSELFFPEDLWFVEIDEGQFSEVINNLIINAKEAMPEGGNIEISGENVILESDQIADLPEGKYIKLSIRDHGSGISKENLLKIFDPYFTTKSRGSGLGLAVVYSIIKKHNGHIDVISDIGSGTTFYIYLPAFEKQFTVEKEENTAKIKGKGKILLMDDEEPVRKITGRMLNSLGYEVKFAEDGVQVIELYKHAREENDPFDVIIMDLTIPGGMGGKEAIIKLLEIDPNVKVIAFSGYANDPIMVEFKKYGFSGSIDINA